MRKLKNQTKLVWSLDSQILDERLADELAGNQHIDGLKLVYDPRGIEQLLAFIPQVAERRNPKLAKLAIMIDVGSKARAQVVGSRDGLELTYGQKVSLVPVGQEGDLQVEARDWGSLFVPEASIFLGHGNVVLKARRVENQRVEAEVLQGGVIHQGIDIHVPVTRKPSSIFDLSYIDIKPLQQIGVDYVVLPGVATAREVALVRKRLSSKSDDSPWLIVKMDCKNVYDNFRELLSEADGLVISRRELALTMEPAIIPMLCKEVIKECNERAKLVFIESEMLASMRYNPTPTRAEVSDVANAVMDGTDAVVLSEEIALGKYTSRALSLCSSIIRDVEEQTNVEINWQRNELRIQSEFDAVAYHAYKTAERLNAKAIVCITKGGNTALRLASFRVPMPIIAVTFSEHVRRRLAPVRGVYSLVLEVDPNLDEVLPVVSDRLKQEGWLTSGDRIVFVTVTLSPVGREASNLFTVQRID